MKDMFGQELEVGDLVYYTNSTSPVYKCYIVGFTPKNVKIEYEAYNWESTVSPSSLIKYKPIQEEE